MCGNEHHLISLPNPLSTSGGELWRSVLCLCVSVWVEKTPPFLVPWPNPFSSLDGELCRSTCTCMLLCVLVYVWEWAPPYFPTQSILNFRRWVVKKCIVLLVWVEMSTAIPSSLPNRLSSLVSELWKSLLCFCVSVFMTNYEHRLSLFPAQSIQYFRRLVVKKCIVFVC